MSAWEEKRGADLEGKERNSGGICNLKQHVSLSSSYSHPPFSVHMCRQGLGKYICGSVPEGCSKTSESCKILINISSKIRPLILNWKGILTLQTHFCQCPKMHSTSADMIPLTLALSNSERDTTEMS